MIKTVAFDLGGVVLTIDNSEPIRRLKEIGVDHAEAMLDPYVQSGFFGDLEVGKIDEEAFRQRLSEEAQRELTWKECQYMWMGYVAEVPQWSIDAVKAVRELGYRVVLASNTNGFIQSWADSADFSPEHQPIGHYFDRLYRSFEMKVMKPDELFFHTILRDERLFPEEVLFVDDGARNCAVASEIGMYTHCAVNGANWKEDVINVLKRSK